jgi:DNA-binding XRE family transcriptional regulator
VETKRGILEALNEEISRLQGLVDKIQASEDPDFRPIDELSTLLVARRESLNMSPAEVAELCGLSPTTYRSIERGSGNPRINTLRTVCDVLNVKLWVDLP